VIARVRKFLADLNETFWLVPGLLVLIGVISALALVEVDRARTLPKWVLESSWLYGGGATGARTLLGAVASSTIGVAGTVFSITIAALSLAAGQMGPRLLRNFTKDRGNQITLGALLGTFSYALMVLRSVRTPDEGDFVPHLSLSIGILLAFVCVATLVYFMGHMAGRISVDTVIDLVSEDVDAAIRRLTTKTEQPAAPPHAFWENAVPIVDRRHGYLQQLDESGLADWAAKEGTAIKLLIRPGGYVFPGAPIAVMAPPVDAADAAIRNATALGPQRTGSADIEFAVRQLVEVAVRALSPGINDPHTAISVLDRLGSALCDLAPLFLMSGVSLRDEKPALVVLSVDYGGLTDSMFHMIRQNAAGNPAILIRMIEVLSAVVSCDHDATRVNELRRHARLVLEDAERSISSPSDLADVRTRYDGFVAVAAGHHKY
jgi:uncharacterized membrane protein